MATRIHSIDSRNFLTFTNTDKNLLINVALTVGFACLLGVLSQIKVYLPGTPVPITGQTLGVMLAGAFLGWKRGSLSVLFYIGLGFNGVPWFSGGATGVNLFTVGFLLGFVPQAAIVGYFVEKFKAHKDVFDLLLVMILSSIVLYIFGSAWIYLVAAPVVSKILSFSQVLGIAVVPFLFVAAVKIYLSALIINAVKK
ncbi:MAG: biotin transporter BioY [Planctomycetes bacterium]|nr:biotin transporter BioY [Planctomycetota bacterium]